jgi:hypothetical protein
MLKLDQTSQNPLMKNSAFLLLFNIFYISPLLIAQVPNLSFEASFEDSLDSKAGVKAAVSSNLSFRAGVLGKGVFIDSASVLQYPIQDNINATAGSMTLWVRPDWNPGELLYRIMVLGNEQRNFELHLDEGGSLAFSVNTFQLEDKPIRVALGYAGNWQRDNWYFLTYTWNADQLKIYVNGQLLAEVEVGFEIPITTEANFHLGSLEGGQAFRGTMDELRIYDGVLSPELVESEYNSYLSALPKADAISIFNIFDEDVTAGLTLVDWEGPVRNPAMKYYLKGNETLVYPIIVNLSSQEELAFFSLPSTISKNGPMKTMEIASEETLEAFLFSVFMDENFEEETFELLLQYSLNGTPAQQVIPVKVLDQDLDRPLTYPVTIDFSEAISPLMTNAKSQEVISYAADHWLYYVDGEGIDEIPVGGSFLDIGGNDHLFAEKRATNSVAYKGYYLFAYGNSNAGPCVCSTGFPNRDLLQTKNGVEVPIFRIGGLHLNLLGQAFETPPTGWEVLSPYENWTQQDYIGTDMYTLAQHEIGHAMVFENSPLFLEAQQRLGFTSPALTAYYPDEVVPLFPNSLSHVIGVLDPASQVPPYGGGVDEEVMPIGRPLVTKLDILIMESVGYPIRDNGVTRPLSLSADQSFNGTLDSTFQVQLTGNGGIPVYHYEMTAGVLPMGITFDVKTGMLSGAAKEIGEFPVTFQVKDYDERSLGATLETTISIKAFTTSLREIPLNGHLKVYPNPASGEFMISMDHPETGRVELLLLDLAGKVVKSRSINKTTAEWKETMSVEGLLPGVYFLKVRQNQSAGVYKLMVN